MIIRKIFTFVLIVIIVAGGAWFYKAYKTVPELPAYDHDLVNESGIPEKISDHKGRYVLISYFQTWCGSCIKELPSIDALQMKVGKENLKVVLISDESMTKILHFKERYCNTLDFYQSPVTLKDLSIRVFPTTYLLDREGKVIISKLDYYNWDNDQVSSLIK
jgi:thiol-disulfide isomerase/thioredoxin